MRADDYVIPEGNVVAVVTVEWRSDVYTSATVAAVGDARAAVHVAWVNPSRCDDSFEVTLTIATPNLNGWTARGVKALHRTCAMRTLLHQPLIEWHVCFAMQHLIFSFSVFLGGGG